MGPRESGDQRNSLTGYSGAAQVSEGHVIEGVVQDPESQVNRSGTKHDGEGGRGDGTFWHSSHVTHLDFFGSPVGVFLLCFLEQKHPARTA